MNKKKVLVVGGSSGLGIHITKLYLNKRDCAKSLKEISRVSKGKSFITVDEYKNKKEKERMFKWNLTAKTIMSDKEWVS